MSTLILASSWLVLSGVAAGQTVHTVPADLTESLQLYYDAYGGGYEEEWIATQENDALQTIVSWHMGWPGSGEASAEIRRTFLEFTLPDVEGTATLVLEKYYDSGNTDPGRRILVATYRPDDDLTTDDFDQPVTAIGTLTTDPSVGEETVTFDLTAVLRKYAGERVGIRLSVVDEGPGQERHLFAGAAFEDSYNGAEPTIEIVEGRTVVLCHAAALTLAVDANSVPAHLGHGDTAGACP